MHQYECESCKKICEIEEIEATLYSHDHEYYEHGQCQECFYKESNEEELDEILIHKERGEGITEVPRDVSNGNLTIRNVPHLFNDGERFADGELHVLPSRSAYFMAFIFQNMISKGIKEYDFRDYKHEG